MIGESARKPGHACGRDRLPRMRRSAAGRRRTPVGAEQRLHAHGRGQVGDVEQPVQVVHGEHQHAEHAVGAVDQREPLLLGQRDRVDPGLQQGIRGMPAGTLGVEHLALPISASATADSGARSPEQPSEPYSGTTGTMSAFSIPARASTVDGRHPGVPGGQGTQPQQHQRAHHLGSTAAPAPAVCERMSERCRAARRSGGMCRVASAPNPVDTP